MLWRSLMDDFGAQVMEVLVGGAPVLDVFA